MTSDEKLDAFLKANDIKLLPFQRELLKQMLAQNKIYICHPPNFGRTDFRVLQYVMATLLKGET